MESKYLSLFQERYSAEKYVENIKMVLDLLLSEVPRMLVNIVPMFTITPLKQVTKGRGCDIFHKFVHHIHDIVLVKQRQQWI